MLIPSNAVTLNHNSKGESGHSCPLSVCGLKLRIKDPTLVGCAYRARAKRKLKIQQPHQGGRWQVREERPITVLTF